MATPFIGEIIVVPYNFAPRNFAFCDGQTLAISQNTALFALLGTTYGGNGITNFNLPDLRSRVPLHQGQGPGLSNNDLGAQGGEEGVGLTISQIPAHTHALQGTTNAATTRAPQGELPAVPQHNIYANTAPTTLAPGSVGVTGGSQPHNNIQPYLAVHFCIALQGIFPSRN